MRLGGIGSSATEGYVEALGTNGQWGGVCDNSFNLFDAHVICTMLGFPTALEAIANSKASELYGPSPSGYNFVLDKLDCRGSESSIFHCPLANEITDICGPTQIAGVKCSTSKI